jgi:hypothetical protein
MMRLLATIHVSAVIAFASITGCATPPDAHLGTLQIPLVQGDGTGTQFRLSGQFAVAGPGETLTVDASGDAPAVALSLAPGDYTVRLFDGWHLERSLGGQPFQPVDAVLGTPNPQPVTIAPGGSATAVFFFLASVGDHGSLTITFGALPLRARLRGTLHATFATGPLEPYLDHPATFVIAYSADSEGRLFLPPTRHEVESVLNELTFLDDPVGVLSTGTPVSSVSLEYKVEAELDGSQFMLLTLNCAGVPGVGLQFLFASAFPLVPALPITDLGDPADAGSVGLRTSTSFTANIGPGGEMSGTVDLEFDSAE